MQEEIKMYIERTPLTLYQLSILHSKEEAFIAILRRKEYAVKLSCAGKPNCKQDPKKYFSCPRRLQQPSLIPRNKLLLKLSSCKNS